MAAIGWVILGGALGSAATYVVMSGMLNPPAETGFRRVTGLFPEGTSLKAEISAAMKPLSIAFGEPDRYDGPETFNEWVFQGPGGPFTVYDKDHDNSKGKGPKKWHVGGRSDAKQFLAWLRSQIAGRPVS